jgi:hypothetical protein
MYLLINIITYINTNMASQGLCINMPIYEWFGTFNETDANILRDEYTVYLSEQGVFTLGNLLAVRPSLLSCKVVKYKYPMINDRCARMIVAGINNARKHIDYSSDYQTPEHLVPAQVPVTEMCVSQIVQGIICDVSCVITLPDGTMIEIPAGSMVRMSRNTPE